MRKMLEESSDTRRRALPATPALAVMISLHLLTAGFFPADVKSFAPDSNSISHSQRCGDHILFSFNDRAGKNIAPAKFESIMITLNGSATGHELDSNRKGTKEFGWQTLCGHREMKVTVIYRKKKMELILKEVPGDQGDIFLHAIPFSEGVYTFDFENHLDKTCREEVNGRRGQCIVSPERLKKITPDRRKQGVTK